MSVLRIVGAGILAAACGCATRATAEDAPIAPGDDPISHVRRDNAALRRRVQMLEDRVLHMEQRTGQSAAPTRAPTPSDGPVAGAHTLPDGRELPVVRLAPGAAAAAPSHVAASPRYEPAPASAPAEPPNEIYAEPLPAADPSRSYHLVGSRLVDITKQHAPSGPDRPDRGTKGQATISEYEAAMTIYKSGQTGRAESAFSQFAAAHPRHEYADNALYWKGEASYDQHHYADALASFTEVVERYGGGNKAPDALLKIGLCYRQLGDLPNARDVLTELIAAYPGERASDIARVKLAELES